MFPSWDFLAISFFSVRPGNYSSRFHKNKELEFSSLQEELTREIFISGKLQFSIFSSLQEELKNYTSRFSENKELEFSNRVLKLEKLRNCNFQTGIQFQDFKIFFLWEILSPGIFQRLNKSRAPVSDEQKDLQKKTTGGRGTGETGKYPCGNPEHERSRQAERDGEAARLLQGGKASSWSRRRPFGPCEASICRQNGTAELQRRGEFIKAKAKAKAKAASSEIGNNRK